MTGRRSARAHTHTHIHDHTRARAHLHWDSPHHHKRVLLDQPSLSNLLGLKHRVPPTSKCGSAHRPPESWPTSDHLYIPPGPFWAMKVIAAQHWAIRTPAPAARTRAAPMPASAGLALRGRGALGAGPAAPPGKLREARRRRHILQSSGSRRAESSWARTKQRATTARASRTLSHGAPDWHPR